MLIRSRFQFLLIKFLSAPYSADSMDDLVKSEPLYYEKFTDVLGPSMVGTKRLRAIELVVL